MGKINIMMQSAVLTSLFLGFVGKIVWILIEMYGLDGRADSESLTLSRYSFDALQNT
jgi:hypothetical protein